MFEHLGHIPETTQGKDTTQWKKYLSFLLSTVFIFVLVASITSGPETSASQVVAGDYINVRVVASNVSKEVVANTPKITIFDFVINTDTVGVSLSRLKVQLIGTYDFSLFSNLKLVYNGTQLGNISQVDDQGNVYFDIDHFSLPTGANIFNLILTTPDTINPGDVLKVGIEDPNDLMFTYKGHPFAPDGDFPILGGTVSFVSHGQIKAYNNFRIRKFLAVEGVPYQIASFSLMNEKEMADVKSLIISYDSQEDFSGAQFLLLQDKKILAQTVAQEEGRIVFNFDKLLVLRPDQKVDFDLHSLGLPKGEYNFYLSSAEANGYASKEKSYLDRELLLSHLEVVDYYPEFSLGDLDEDLTLGWNKIYDLKIKAVGSKDIKLNKLTWSLDLDKVGLSDVELVIDNKVYPVDLILTDDKVVAKFNWQEPLPISNTSTEIVLLVKVKNIEPGANILTYLLSDQEPLAEDGVSANIIWSIEDNLYNSYLVPYLPLDPSVLGN